MASLRHNRAAQSAATPATILTLLQLRCAASYWQHYCTSRSVPGIDTDLIQELLTQAFEAGCSRAQLDDAEQYGKASFLRGHSPTSIGYSPEQFAATLREHLDHSRQQ